MWDTKILMVRYGIEKFFKGVGFLILIGGRGRGVRHSFKIDGGMRDENRKSHVTDVTLRTAATLTRCDSQIHSDWSRVTGLNYLVK